MQHSNILQWLLVLNLLSRHDPCQGTYVAILALPHDPVFMLCHNLDPKSGSNKCFHTSYPQLRSAHFVIRVASVTNFSSSVVADLGCSSLLSASVLSKSFADAHSSNQVHGFQAEVQSINGSSTTPQFSTPQGRHIFLNVQCDNVLCAVFVQEETSTWEDARYGWRLRICAE